MLATIAVYRDAEPRLTHDFALCFRGRLWDELESFGVRPHDLGKVRLRNPFSVYLARRRSAKLMREQAYDVVITHACWPHIVFGPEVRRTKTRLVNWVHDALTGMHRIERTASKTPPDLAIANSRHTAATICTVYPQVRCEVIHCMIDKPALHCDETRESIRESVGTPAEATVLLQVSRMESWKGHKVLLEALGKIRSNQDWVLWIVGGAQRPSEVAYEAELKALVNKLNLADRIKFLGQRPDVARLMSAADLFCQTNESPEPFGVVFVEALYAGLPVVSSNFGGAIEIVDNSCGVLVPPNDPASLAITLTSMITDKPLRQRLSQAGPARAKLLCDPVNRLKQLADTLESTPGA